jgi:hypothetical protein
MAARKRTKGYLRPYEKREMLMLLAFGRPDAHSVDLSARVSAPMPAVFWNHFGPQVKSSF